MKLLFIIAFSLFGIVLFWHLLTKKYINPYTLSIIFGKKGCGKSTLLQKLAFYYRKRGFHVYCNVGDSSIKECSQIVISDLPRLSEAGHRLEHYNDDSLVRKITSEYRDKGLISSSSPVPGEPLPLVRSPAVILCDEINLLWDNRNFKAFSPEIQRYFRLQRHYKHKFIGFSQTFDCDKKIRDLADSLYICRRIARVFIWCKGYVKKVVVVSPENGNNRETASITDDFVKLGLLSDLFAPFHAWLPKWVKYHDSFK